jgi:hypothetical protein
MNNHLPTHIVNQPKTQERINKRPRLTAPISGNFQVFAVNTRQVPIRLVDSDVPPQPDQIEKRTIPKPSHQLNDLRVVRDGHRDSKVFVQFTNPDPYLVDIPGHDA